MLRQVRYLPDPVVEAAHEPLAHEVAGLFGLDHLLVGQDVWHILQSLAFHCISHHTYTASAAQGPGAASRGRA